MPCGWEGNRRPGVALAMRHRLQWFIQLRAHGLDREMSTPPTLLMGHNTPLSLQRAMRLLATCTDATCSRRNQQTAVSSTTYSFNHDCQTAGVHENRTICRRSSIKLNVHYNTTDWQISNGGDKA